jgi:hypothetical protein
MLLWDISHNLRKKRRGGIRRNLKVIEREGHYPTHKHIKKGMGLECEICDGNYSISTFICS